MLTCRNSGCSLLKFRDGDESTYDEYRDCAGKLVLAKGGHLAFLGKATKASWHSMQALHVRSVTALPCAEVSLRLLALTVHGPLSVACMTCYELRAS